MGTLTFKLHCSQMSTSSVMRKYIGILFLFTFTLVIQSAVFQPSIVNAGEVTDDSLALPVTVREQPGDTASVNTDLDTRLRWSDMFVNIPRDWVRWPQAAFRSDNILPWLAVAGSTALLIATDDQTYEPSKKFYESDERVASASDFLSNLGDGRTQFGLSGAFALYGWLANDMKALHVASQIVETVLASGIVVQVLKHSTGRQSPIVATTPTGRWKFFPGPLEYHSKIPAYDAYPSGHVTTTLATVIVLAENYPDAKWIRPVGYTLIAGIGIGMANNSIHWYSDYPLAILLGYTFGMIAAHPEGFDVVNKTTENSPALTVQPFIARQGGGVTMTLSF